MILTKPFELMPQLPGPPNYPPIQLDPGMPQIGWFTADAQGRVSHRMQLTGNYPGQSVTNPAVDYPTIYVEKVMGVTNWNTPTYGDYGAGWFGIKKVGGTNMDCIGLMAYADVQGGTGDVTAFHARGYAGANSPGAATYAGWFFLDFSSNVQSGGGGGTCVEFNIFNDSGLNSQHFYLGAGDAMTILNVISENPGDSDHGNNAITCAYQEGRNVVYNNDGSVKSGGSRFWSVHYLKSDGLMPRDETHNLSEWAFLNGGLKADATAPNGIQFAGNWFYPLDFSRAAVQGALMNLGSSQVQAVTPFSIGTHTCSSLGVIAVNGTTKYFPILDN